MLPAAPVLVSTILLVALFWTGHVGVKTAVGRTNLLAEAEMQSALAVVAEDPASRLQATNNLLGQANEANLIPEVSATVKNLELTHAARLDSLVETFAARRHAIQHGAEVRFLWFSGTGLTLMLAGAATGVFLWRRRWAERWERVGRLSDEVSVMARAPLDARFEPSGINDEVGRIEAVLSTVAPQLADTLVHQQRLSLMGEQVAYIAHDIRSPLTAIIMSLELLTEDAANAETREFLRSEAERARTLADELRSFAKRSDAVIDCDLRAEAEATARSVRHRTTQAGVTVEVAAGPTASVRARPNEIRQVLVNLLENAIDAAAGSATKLVRLSIELDGPQDVLVAVEDSGPGIPSADMSHIFESFYTTKSSGTGMGLAISRRIVESGGGRIDVCGSPVLGGALFRLRLPAAPSATLAGQLPQ